MCVCDFGVCLGRYYRLVVASQFASIELEHVRYLIVIG